MILKLFNFTFDDYFYILWTITEIANFINLLIYVRQTESEPNNQFLQNNRVNLGTFELSTQKKNIKS